jgi:Ni/Fe-hydrogenase subunit HybB-like protein
MTIFAVMCAGRLPGHPRRPRVVGLLPLPDPEPALHVAELPSPLLWDVFAVSTYATVSLLFWYIGMIPDLATLRDRAKTKACASSPTGSSRSAGAARNRHWHVYEKAYLLLAALGDPAGALGALGRVSFDFAVSQVPGWHTTIFPPYFVAGAIFSGFAMVLTLMIPPGSGSG